MGLRHGARLAIGHVAKPGAGIEKDDGDGSEPIILKPALDHLRLHPEDRGGAVEAPANQRAGPNGGSRLLFATVQALYYRRPTLAKRTTQAINGKFVIA